MADLFLKLLAMSISAGWLVLAIMLLRIFFRNAPKWLFPALWSLVWLRLLLPKLPESSLSLIPDAASVGAAAQAAVSGEGRGAAFYAGVLWCAGMTGMLLYEAVSYLRLHRRLKTAVRLSGNLYQSEYADVPFITGLFSPRIYLPVHMDRQNFDSVIAHERAHIRRGDHWLKPIAFLLLSVYWFHPLIWAAYLLLCRDMELACDASAIRNMDDPQRAAYSQALLSCTAHRPAIAACPLAFGSRYMKKRIRSVLDYRKPGPWTLLAAAVLTVLLSVCFMTEPRHSEQDTPLAQYGQEIAAGGILNMSADHYEMNIPGEEESTDPRIESEIILIERIVREVIYEKEQILSQNRNG